MDSASRFENREGCGKTIYTHFLVSFTHTCGVVFVGSIVNLSVFVCLSVYDYRIIGENQYTG